MADLLDLSVVNVNGSLTDFEEIAFHIYQELLEVRMCLLLLDIA